MLRTLQSSERVFLQVIIDFVISNSVMGPHYKIRNYGITKLNSRRCGQSSRLMRIERVILYIDIFLLRLRPG